MKINTSLISGTVESNSRGAHDLYEKSLFGEKSGQKIVYSVVEAFYLFEKGKLEVFDYKSNILSEAEILKKFSRIDKRFRLKYPVFKNLRSKGYIVKSASKFGSDFRVYDKKTKELKGHSKFVVQVFSENSKVDFQEFASRARISHSVKKNLVIAVVNSEESISYFNINWTKP